MPIVYEDKTYSMDVRNKSGNRIWETDNYIQGAKLDGNTLTVTPKVDVRKRKNAYIVSASIPGFNLEDISISIKGNILDIEGMHEAARISGRENAPLYRVFRRSFALPELNDEPATYQAEFEDDRLEITIPIHSSDNGIYSSIKETIVDIISKCRKLMSSFLDTFGRYMMVSYLEPVLVNVIEEEKNQPETEWTRIDER